ncbi:MAG TPA: 2-phospho-L-lactate transferase CofD family protein [Candidatus Saccharimonadales bacterium]|jgi:2-phospho-L-lactate transferase/gluconeogenesis factor (CofD/UPF0052 family)
MNYTNFDKPFTRVYAAGGGAGELVAGYLDAVEAGRIDGITLDNVNTAAIVPMADSGGGIADVRKLHPEHGPLGGDGRKSISALSRSRQAARIFESRFAEDTTIDHIQASQEDLLKALSEEPGGMDSFRMSEIMARSLDFAKDMQRFRELDGRTLKGLTLGHLTMTALALELGDTDLAAQEGGKLMNTRAEVIPVSTVPHHLWMRDGPAEVDGNPRNNMIYGEHEIDEYTPAFPHDLDLGLYPVVPGTGITPNPRAVKAVDQLGEFVAGPSSRRTSLGAILIPLQDHLQRPKEEGMTFALGGNLTAVKSEPETNGEDHVAEIEKFAGRKIDVIIAHKRPDLIPGGKGVRFDVRKLRREGYTVVETDLVNLERAEQDPNSPIKKEATVKTNYVALATAVKDMPVPPRNNLEDLVSV